MARFVNPFQITSFKFGQWNILPSIASLHLINILEFTFCVNYLTSYSHTDTVISNEQNGDQNRNRSFAINYCNILTTGYCNFWQSDWFPTRGIWGNLPLLPYLGSPVITSLGHVHLQSHVFQNNKYLIFPLFVPSFFPR